VQLHVPLHRIQPDKFLTAERALVWLLARVLALVDGQMRSGREPFSALLTTERSLPSVGPHVDGEGPRNTEAATAENALVPFLAAVG